MRIFLPATAQDLSQSEVSSRRAHAATASLAQALPDEDEEGLEVSASLCAADTSVLLLASQDTQRVPRRLVIAADVDAQDLRELPVDEDVLPGTVELLAPVQWDDVAALLLDEAAVQAEVTAAADGDEDAFERVAEADLLWYDVSERAALARELGV